MNQESNEFVALRRLLALKRHEQPPPGYYDRLAQAIRSRLAEEQERSPWWSRLFTLVEVRPAWAGAFAVAVAVAGLYVLGVTLSGSPKPPADAAAGWALGSFAADPQRGEPLTVNQFGVVGTDENLAPALRSLKSASNSEHTGEWVLPTGFSVTRP